MYAQGHFSAERPVMRLTPRIAYMILFASALPTALTHICLASPAIERTRMWTGFLPATTLFWRWLGELSCAFTVVPIAFLLLSLRRQWFNAMSAPLALGLVQLGLTTVYAAYSALLLSHLLLEN